MSTHGTVFLVGAGPGDPGLLTVRAGELLAQCDCVVHDWLVNPAILARVPLTAARHHVGKRGGATSISQDEINQLLIGLARRHRRIVRLKGGDPFLFGRGGEEAGALAGAGIPFEVVPGVTSGIGVPAYAGIPVTHRAASSVVAFAAGHQQHGGDLDWGALARCETVVLYMGMHKLTENCASLIAAGRSGDTPAAAIQWGTYPRQRVVTGTLATLPQLTTEAGLGAPAITVVGDVVRWREKLRWFDLRPLSGKRIAVTRSREQASELADLLGQQGAEVVELAVARQEPPLDWAGFDAAAATPPSGWIAFSSANAVRFTWRRLRELGRDARWFGAAKVAAVGPATAAALAECGITADLVPDRYDAEALANAIRASGTVLRALLPQADNARPTLAERLTAAGCAVTAVTAYRNVPEPVTLDPTLPLDAVTFASSATAERFVAGIGLAAAATLVKAGCRFYAIGPTTAATMRTLGLPLAAMADEATVTGLVAAVTRDLGPSAR